MLMYQQSIINRQTPYIDIAGPVPEDPANLLSSQRMRELMAAFERTCDLILVDAAGSGYGGAILTASFLQWCRLVSHMGKGENQAHAGYSHAEAKLNVIGVA